LSYCRTFPPRRQAVLPVEHPEEDRRLERILWTPALRKISTPNT
jgi:hypothetical protein